MNLPGKKKILKETVKVTGLCVFSLEPPPPPFDPLSRISARAANWPTLPPDLPTYWPPDSNLDGGKAAAGKSSVFVRVSGRSAEFCWALTSSGCRKPFQSRSTVRHKTRPRCRHLFLQSIGCESTESGEVTEEAVIKLLTVQLKSAAC